MEIVDSHNSANNTKGNKISVIIPIYRVEDFLPQCLDSVINQTHQNLEIILVDDGSPDSCPQICDNYAKKDDRIKVIHQQNGGLSAARNTGLKIATGDFIAFVDSDDLVSVVFCEKLLTAAIKNNAEIVECNYLKFKTEKEVKAIPNNSNTENQIYDTQNALRLLMQEHLKQVVWNKLYRIGVLKNIQFPEGSINEDEFWTYKVFGNSNIIIKIPDVLYFYRQQEASIMGRSYHIKRLDGLAALEERIGYMKMNFPELENLAIKVFCTASLWHYQKIDQHHEIDSEKIFRKKIVRRVKKYDKLSIFIRWKPKEVFWYQFFVTSPNFCTKLRNYIKVGI